MHGGENFPNSEENLDEPSGILEVLPDKNGGEPPLDFVEFKDQIDTHGGYVQTLALTICDFHDKIDRAEALQAKFAEGIKKKIDNNEDDLECNKEQKDFLRTFVVAPLIPDLKDKYKELLAEDEYPEEGCSFVGKSQDEWLPLIRGWLKHPLQRPEGLTDKQYLLFTRFAKGFFVDKEGRLYRRSIDSCHKLVVEKSCRVYMMRAAHDSLGHRGSYATKNMLGERFWWPDIECNITWYMKTCHHCQERSKRIIEIPLMVMHMP